MIPTRLYWAHGRGRAEHEGVRADFDIAPRLPGVTTPITELDYAPSVRVAQVREACDAQREMTPLEAAACMLILKRLVAAARAALLEPIGPDLKP